jgi:putative ABC transport system permease protein
LHRIWDDVRLGLRGFRRTPAFFVAAVGLLAFGIGAASAIFSIAATVLVRDLPMRDQDHIIALWANARGAATEVPTTLDRYERFRRQTKTLSEIAGIAHYGSNMTPLRDGTAALHARESLVTGNFFDVLGTRPVIGRLLRPEDDVKGAPWTMVISESFWRSNFAMDPSVIGRRIDIMTREVTATIIGVAPAGLEYPEGTDYWIAIVPTGYPAIDLVARLAPHATPAAARAEFAAFIRQDTRTHPDEAGAHALLAAGTEARLLTDVMIGPARQPLVVLTLAVASLLLIACVNVGNLVLVRTTARTRELAIRRALGAAQSRILAQLAAEIGTLALFGGLAGAALSFAIVRTIIALAPPALPRVDQISFSPAAVLMAGVATTLTLLATGVLPATILGGSLTVALRADSRGGVETSGRRKLRSGLVASQIALALVLLVVAGLLSRSLFRLESIDLGYVPDHLSILQTSTHFRKYKTAQQFNDAFDDVARHVRAVPGVTAITPVLAVPFLGTNVFATRIEVRDRPDLSGSDAPYVSWDAVGPEFSQAMNVPIIRGRGVLASDRADAPPVAVVTQDLANYYWPGENPLGKQLRFAGLDGDTAWHTVVGVTRPFNYRTLRGPTPTVLFPYRQQFQQGLFAVRSSRDLATILPELRRAVGASDEDVVLWRAQTMDQILGGPLGRPRLEAFLLLAFAGTALVLAAVGLYGVTAYLVRQQTREIGIRIALGADPGRVLEFALGGAIRVAIVGVAVGALISFAGSRMLRAQLFAISPGDPIAFLGAAAVLVLAVAVASFIPARRATRIDPTQALRSE